MFTNTPDLKSLLSDNPLMSSVKGLSGDERLLLEARLIGMRELPPSIDQFLEDDFYLGQTTNNGKNIYPKWRDFFRELFPDPLHTTHTVINQSGAIGTGKTSSARIILAYDLLKLTYFDDLEYAGLNNVATGKSIDIVFNHRTGGKAYEEIIEPFQIMMDKSPYFSKHLYNDYGTRLLADGPLSNVSIGKDILSFVASEVNFQPEHKIKEKVNEVTSRITSRFGKLLPYLGHVILDSSEGEEGNFVEQYLKTTAWPVKTAKYSQWEMKSHLNMFFVTGSFSMYTGDSTKDPFIIEGKDQITPTMNPDKIIDCPMELIAEAKADPRRFLREKAGVASEASDTFIPNKDKLDKALCIDKEYPDIIKVDFYNQTESIWEYLKDAIMEIPPEKRLYVGLDLGIVEDCTGLAIAYVDDLEAVGSVELPVIKVPIAVGISRLPGQETPIYKISDFILTLNKFRDVSLVSVDQFQSWQLRQDLSLKKIKVKLSSVDRTTEPYNYLKNIMYMGLLKLPKSSYLRDELANLVDTGKKIDHKNNTSKDVSDGVAQAVFNLFLDLKVAKLISGRYNVITQLDMMDELGMNHTSEKDIILAEMIRRMSSS